MGLNNHNVSPVIR